MRNDHIYNPFSYKKNTSMQNSLVSLAGEIIRGGERGLQANEEFRNIINNYQIVGQCLSLISTSDQYNFVYCTNMLKLIQNGDFNIYSETKSEENVSKFPDGGDQTKVKVYGQMVFVLAENLIRTEKASYLTRSMIDLTAMCLKQLFQDTCNVSILQKTIRLFLAHYELPANFNLTATDGALQEIVSRYPLEQLNYRQYCIMIKIFISLFDYLTIQNTTKSYYQYRRVIYIFRNSYLGYFLYLGIEHCKVFFNGFNGSEDMKLLLGYSFELLEAVFMYPFTLSLHEFQAEDDSVDNISGSNAGDVYFPSFFRHGLLDIPFMDSLLKYLNMLLTNGMPFDSKRTQIMSIVKVVGRVCIPSQYTFKSDDEKKVSRQFAHNFLKYITVNYTYTDFYYINTIMDIIYKLLTMYDFYFSNIKSVIVDLSLNFLYKAIQEVQIRMEEGRKNPFAKIFQLLSTCIEMSKDKAQMEEQLSIRGKSQQILEKAFERIVSNQADAIMNAIGYDQPNQIECFNQLFQYILSAFQLNLEANLNIFQSISVQNMSQGAITVWLHLCSQLLPKTTANMQQTQLILKYYELAKSGNSLASLRFIKTLITELLGDLCQGEPNCALWLNIHEVSNASFQYFLQVVIELCIGNFSSTNNQLLDYSLDLFKTIYINLKKNQHKSFDEFYGVVKNLLQRIGETIFAVPKYYHKRRDFFNVISVIWINSDNIAYIYEIHSLVIHKISDGSPQSFFQYLNDITGLLEPIDIYQAFEVLTQLIVDDLSNLFSLHFSDESKILMYFKQPAFMKIFCKLVYALVNDLNRKLFFESHTKIPLQINNLFVPILKILAQGGFQYPKHFATILQRIINLNPLTELVPFPNIANVLKEQNSEAFDRLIRVYFDNVHRLGDINWIYDYIQSNAEFMVSWWQQAMMRGMHPQVNFKVIAESRFWSSNRQKDTFAKLLFELAYYSKDYWSMSDQMGERDFVEEFSKMYG